MWEKIYPKTMTLRQGILFAGVGIIIVVMLVVVWNWQMMANRKPSAQKEETVSTLASSADTDWFKQAKPEKTGAVPTAVPAPSIKSVMQKATVIKAPQVTVMPDSDREAQEERRALEEKRRAEAADMQAPIKSNMLTPETMMSTRSGGSGSAKNSASSKDSSSEKEAFLDNGSHVQTGLAKIQNPVTPYELLAGTIIPGVMIDGVNSDLPGTLTGQVTSPVYDTVTGRYLLIPQGSKLSGIYDSNVFYGQEGLLVIWTQIQYPNGQILDLEGMPGADLSGYVGFRDQVDNHYWQLLKGVLLMTALDVGAQQSQPSDSGNNASNPNVTQTMAASAGINLTTTMNGIVRKSLNIPPTIKIRPAYPFVVKLKKNLVFSEPYQGESSGENS